MGKLRFAADFEDGGLERWRATDAAAWRIEDDPVRGKVLALFGESKYEPDVRSPFNINLLKDLEIGSFVMELKIRSTIEDYYHRDICLFFGYQDPSHFYYVHLGKTADPHANSVFIVDGAPRLSIASNRSDGTDWDDEWHHVRLVRDVEEGTVEVYFDDMSTPVMSATNDRFGSGKIGVGSFDDTGLFDDIKIWDKK
ncbi:MAG: LamG domain-containing protein [Candidatus Glassbacteria bacterium]|nr:LamG domain-containing protein [Candidatus Glassbacteria bacterium]